MAPFPPAVAFAIKLPPVEQPRPFETIKDCAVSFGSDRQIYCADHNWGTLK
jgi:hypothetical protein